MPLANALLTEDQLALPEPAYPLDLVFCPSCTLVQITETVPPEQLFRDYVYMSSFSDTVLENSREIALRLISRRKLNGASLVVEVASNDGYLLRNYVEQGIKVLGIEPALNIAKIARDHGIFTLDEFFGVDLARTLIKQGRPADVIHANNVIAHVADLHGVVQGMSILLKPDAVAVVENHYVKCLIDQVEFDSIYHEHLCYYSVTSFRELFQNHGLTLVDVEFLSVHGGSLRVYFQRTDGPRSLEADGAKRVAQALREEAEWGVGDFGYYRDFGENVERLRSKLTALLRELKGQGKSIAVYGASAKSATLLNYFGIGAPLLEYVVDRSTLKQGKYTPGTHIPIHDPAHLLATQPDYVLLLAWNFADEILSQQSEYRRRGGRFIVPLPELRVV